jgi:drug/metabolite transporter (DMT)-like permease
MLGFLFVTTSALFHAGWNVLLKHSQAKFRFNMNMHIAATLMFTAIMPILYPDSISLDPYVALYGGLGAIFFAIYHLLVAKAYELADVSQVYPITTSSPLFVSVWASFFLDESMTLIGILGMFVTVSGCFIMNGARLGKMSISVGVLVALSSAFAYSFGALFDKYGVNTGNPVMYTYWMTFFMTIFFVVLHFVKHSEKPCKADRKLMVLAGFVMMISSITYRFGLEYMPLSYAVATRQVSGLFGVLIGIIFLHEGYGKMRIIGALVIISGITLLRIGL